jgi:hypothetical protein
MHPGDSAFRPQDWTNLKGAWTAVRDQALAVSQGLIGASTFSATTVSAALTTSLSVSVGFVSNPSAPPVVQLQTVLQRSRLFEDVLELLIVFGLNVGHQGSRSPTELLREGHTALAQSSAAGTSPVSVLISARESIDHALAILIRRRAQQEPVRKQKVVSIGAQCGLDGLDADHFARLEANFSALSTRLSASKQAAMARAEVSTLFNEVLQFHHSLLTSLDPTKLRP